MSRYFFRSDETGRILETAQASMDLGAGWTEVTRQEDIDHIIHEVGRWRQDTTGALVPLHHIRLRVNDPVFKADGEDAAVWSIVSLDLPHESTLGMTVKVTVNGDPQEWHFGELHAVTTTTPGTWVVALADPRYWGETRSVEATAHPPENFAT